MRTLACILLLVVFNAPRAHAQSRMTWSFAFGGGVVTASEAAATPQIFASSIFPIARFGIEAIAGASQNGSFANALLRGQTGKSVYVFYGAGIGISNEHGSAKPLLAGLGGVAIPLAHNGAAALELGARAQWMSGASNLSFGAAMRLSPHRGLVLGEKREEKARATDDARDWEMTVRSLIALQGSLTPLQEVTASPNVIIMRLSGRDPDLLRILIARIAQILLVNPNRIDLAISAPEPTAMAMAATAGGFPPERIGKLTPSKDIILQATRAPTRPAQSLPR